MPRRRWLQFSLRTAFVVLTASCLWLGWRVDRAQRRGRAIDAIAAEGGWVTYGSIPPFYPPDIDHFWLDVRRVPVSIELTLEFPPSREIGSHLSKVDGIAVLDLTDWGEANFQRIQAVNDGCKVIVDATPEGREWLQRKLPRCKVVVGHRKPAL